MEMQIRYQGPNLFKLHIPKATIKDICRKSALCFFLESRIKYENLTILLQQHKDIFFIMQHYV